MRYSDVLILVLMVVGITLLPEYGLLGFPVVMAFSLAGGAAIYGLIRIFEEWGE